jgi:predicted dehydrogenase
MYMCWHLYKDCTIGLVGLLGSHLIDVTTWYMDDPIAASAVTMGGRIAWPNREHDDSQECLFKFPKGFLLQYSTLLGNKIGVPENAFYGTKGTFDTSSWTARGEGANKEHALADPVKVEAAPSVAHVANWLQCIRDNNPKTNAQVQAGYAHSVISIMAAKASDTGRRQIYDFDKREVREG